MDEPDDVLGVDDLRAGGGALDQVPPHPVQLVDDLDRGRRVVDAGGEGAFGDVDKLLDAEADLRVHRPCRPEPDRPVDDPVLVVAEAVVAPDPDDDGAFDDPGADRDEQLDDGVVLLGVLDEPAVVARATCPCRSFAMTST